MLLSLLYCSPPLVIFSQSNFISQGSTKVKSAGKPMTILLPGDSKLN